MKKLKVLLVILLIIVAAAAGLIFWIYYQNKHSNTFIERTTLNRKEIDDAILQEYLQLLQHPGDL